MKRQRSNRWRHIAKPFSVRPNAASAGTALGRGLEPLEGRLPMSSSSPLSDWLDAGGFEGPLAAYAAPQSERVGAAAVDPVYPLGGIPARFASDGRPVSFTVQPAAGQSGPLSARATPAPLGPVRSTPRRAASATCRTPPTVSSSR